MNFAKRHLLWSMLLAALGPLQVQAQVSDPIYLNAGTLTASSRAERAPIKESVGNRLHLVQFAGPIQPQWLEDLRKDGLHVVDYIPDYTYVVWGDEIAIAKLRQRGLLELDSGLAWPGMVNGCRSTPLHLPHNVNWPDPTTVAAKAQPVARNSRFSCLTTHNRPQEP